MVSSVREGYRDFCRTFPFHKDERVIRYITEFFFYPRERIRQYFSRICLCNLFRWRRFHSTTLEFRQQRGYFLRIFLRLQLCLLDTFSIFLCFLCGFCFVKSFIIISGFGNCLFCLCNTCLVFIKSFSWIRIFETCRSLKLTVNCPLRRCLQFTTIRKNANLPVLTALSPTAPFHSSMHSPAKTKMHRKRQGEGRPRAAPAEVRRRRETRAGRAPRLCEVRES